MARIIIDDRKRKFEVEGNRGELLAHVAHLLNEFHKEGIADENDIKEICRIATLSDDEIQSEAEKKIEKMKGLSEKLDKLIEEFMKEV